MTTKTLLSLSLTLLAATPAIDDKHVSWTFGAGLLGRFDL